MTDPTDLKVCTKCKASLPVLQFGVDRQKADGLTSRCKPCRRQDHREYLRDPVVLARTAERAKAWAKNNPDRIAEFQRAWRDRHPGYSAEANRKWREQNPGAAAAYHQANRDKAIRRVNRRRARIKETAAAEPIDLAAIWRWQCGTCPLCDQRIDSSLAHPDPLSKSVDHIVPLSKGGTHERANVQWAHLVCNIRKGARAPDQQAG